MHAADRIATSEGSAGLMTTAWEAGSGVPDVLAEPILDAGDTGFAVHANLGTCLAAYLAARSARSAAAAGGRSPGEAVAAERGWQADWLRTTLQLKG